MVNGSTLRIALAIEPNVFLSFFYYTSGALDHLEALADVAKRGEVRPLIPVGDVFHRDRDIRLSETMKRPGEDKAAGQYPNAFKQDAEYDERRHLRSEFGQLRGAEGG